VNTLDGCARHQSFTSHQESAEGSFFDADQFLFDKRTALDNFFGKVYEELSREPAFAIYFYICFTKQLAREGTCTEQSLDILRRCLKKISQDDIDVLLYFEPDVA
jgi:hypothetical protein